MADPASTPQAFTFQGRQLIGNLTKFTGQSQRRHVVHEFPKRKGARVEDFERGPRRLEVQLAFLGPSCARDFAAFDAALDENPRGLLVHPIAGRFTAFCAGPSHDVDFSRSTSEVICKISFVETELDSGVTASDDVPDAATAAQNVTAAQAHAGQAVAGLMGALAKAQSAVGATQAAIDSALATAASASAPIDLLVETVTSTARVGSSIVGTVVAISAKFTALDDAITGYVDATSDLFAGSDTPTTSTAQTAALLASVDAAARILEAALLAAAPTGAQAADAVGGVEEALAACYVLDAALRAARPPTIPFVVSETIDLVTLAQRRYGRDALTRASEILGLNRIPNPAAIPGGTRLLIPSR